MTGGDLKSFDKKKMAVLRVSCSRIKSSVMSFFSLLSSFLLLLVSCCCFYAPWECHFFSFASWNFHVALDTPSSFERNDIAVTFLGVFCFSLFSAQLGCTQLSRSPQWPLAVRNC